MMKPMTVLSAAFALSVSGTALHADEPAEITVASMEVKERLHSIETINVSSAKEPIAEAPESHAVKALLDEAARIDQEDQAPAVRAQD